MSEEEIREGLADHETRILFLEGLHTESNAHLFKETLDRHLMDFTNILEDEMKFTTKQMDDIKRISLFVKQLSKRLISLEEKYPDKKIPKKDTFLTGGVGR